MGLFGGKKSKSNTTAFNPDALNEIIQGTSDFGNSLGQRSKTQGPEQLNFGQISQGRPSGGIDQLRQGQLTSNEQKSMQEQLNAISAGATGAEQQIEQSVREQSQSRGFLESRGAISQEASQLANIPLFQAQQRANVFGQAGQLQRQGLLASTGFDLQSREQDLQQILGLGQLRTEGRAQDIQNQQFGEQSRQAELELKLRALLGAGQLAGTPVTKSRSSSFSFG